MTDCADKHNNSDLKFCPECGLKLEHVETYIKELNELYDDFKKKMEEYCVNLDKFAFFSFLEKRKMPLKYSIYLIEGKFYSKEQVMKLFANDEACVESTLFYFELYGNNIKLFLPTYGSIEETKKRFESNRKEYDNRTKMQKFIKEFVNNPKIDNFERLLNSFGFMKITDKERLKQLICKYIDEYCELDK